MADRIRARPCSTCRASVRVDSWVRTRPMRGSFTCRRSPWARPTAPVANRHEHPARLPLNQGNLSFGPARVPRRDADQLRRRGREVRQTRGVRLFRVLTPPRRSLVFGPVPPLPQAVRRPRHRWGQLAGPNPGGGFRVALTQVRLHQRQAPVECEPLRPAVRPQRGFLGGCRVHSEPIRLHHRRGHCVTTSAVAHRTPASARRRAMQHDSKQQSSRWARRTVRPRSCRSGGGEQAQARFRQGTSSGRSGTNPTGHAPTRTTS
jgi:hypothetical protein